MAKTMRIIFYGTPEFALPALQRLLESGHEIVLVVTQPDRPKGRGQKLEAAPVKALACWKPTAASYRPHPEGWSLLRPEVLLDFSRQAWLRGLTLREGAGRALRIYTGDGVLLGEWNEPCAVYNSAGALSALS
jgi:hypothetical protein